MIRNAKIGDRVKVIQSGTYSEEHLNGKLNARWPKGASTGTVTNVEHYHQTVLIYVKPDHPKGVGSTHFRPAELERA